MVLVSPVYQESVSVPCVLHQSFCDLEKYSNKFHSALSGINLTCFLRIFPGFRAVTSTVHSSGSSEQAWVHEWAAKMESKSGKRIRIERVVFLSFFVLWPIQTSLVWILTGFSFFIIHKPLPLMCSHSLVIRFLPLSPSYNRLGVMSCWGLKGEMYLWLKLSERWTIHSMQLRNKRQ